MVQLDELLDVDALNTLIESGHIRVRSHPDDDTLLIYNYTEKAQYEKVWTHETLTCRGLVVRDGVVVARPWAKFFNYGEHPDGALDLTAPVAVTDKQDGSLGIWYVAPDGLPAIATRGSFSSEQAIHATAVLRKQYGDWAPPKNVTALFEIVYPENRIVLDYGELDDLVLLGVVHVVDGSPFGPTHPAIGWPGTRTPTLPALTLADALALPPRPNAEGVVVRFIEAGLMVKVKQDDYVLLHRLITGLSERSVWEHMSANDGDITGLLAAVPDEFHQWVRDRATSIQERFNNISEDAGKEFARTHLDLPFEYTRKDFALAAADKTHRSLLFLLEDGREDTYNTAIWRQIRPVGRTSMFETSEDVA